MAISFILKSFTRGRMMTSKEYYQLHKEERLAYFKKYRLEHNVEKNKEYFREYYKRNKEKIKAKSREYHKNNRAVILEKQKHRRIYGTYELFKGASNDEFIQVLSEEKQTNHA